MEKLPLEIRLKIFSHLSFSNKLLCLTVSKQWYSLFVGFLYKDLRFLKDHESNLQNAIKYFGIHEEIAKMVVSIKIDSCPNSYLHLPKLPLLFPNVKEFTFEDVSTGGLTDNSSTTEARWESLETLKLTESVKENRTLAVDGLLKHSYFHLTCVTVRFDDAHPMANLWDPVFNDKKKTLIRNLRNLLFLQTLILDRMHVTMKDLEELHKNAPNLRKLSLENVVFRIDDTEPYNFQDQQTARVDDTIDTRSVPVKLESLQINAFSRPLDADVLLVWLTYIAAKYKMLNSFIFNCKHFSDYRNDNMERQVLQLFHNSPQLKNYDFMLCPLTRRILKEMEDSHIRLNDMSVYANMYTLKNQLEALSKSEQVHCITRAKIFFTNCTHLTFADFTFFADNVATQHNDTSAAIISRHLTSLSNLTHLTVSGQSNSVNLASLYQYLTHLKNLTHITLSNVFIYNRLDTSLLPATLESTRIKYIDIDRIVLSNITSLATMNNIFSQIFPQCPDLETIRIDMTLYVNYGYLERQSMPYSLILDFRSQFKLESIQVSENHGRYYRIIQGKGNQDKYYYHDRSKAGKFIEVPDSGGAEYLTKIYVNNPVLINHKQYYSQ